MDFDEAIKAHASWKIKLSTYIRNPNGSLKSIDIKPDNKCSLGKWIQESSSKHGSVSEYKELKLCHSKFHICAADIVDRADNGENLTDQIALGGKSDYNKLSRDIVKIIMALRKKI
jgi:hypothetical protein